MYLSHCGLSLREYPGVTIPTHAREKHDPNAPGVPVPGYRIPVITRRACDYVQPNGRADAPRFIARIWNREGRIASAVLLSSGDGRPDTRDAI